MRTLGTYLWKEWRDHRAILLGILIAVPVLMAVAGFSLPTKAFEQAWFTQMTALACLAILVISVSCDLVPGEARRGRLDFLRRQPAGLRMAFLAKFALFVALAASSFLYGLVAGGVTSWLAAGQFPDLAVPYVVLILLAIFVLWVFAASCCLPRGVLAVPAAVVAFAVLLVPLALVYKSNPELLPPPKAWFDPTSAAIWTCGAVAAAYLAFVRGRRHGGGIGAAARWGCAVAIVCMLPYWAETAETARAWSGDRTPILRGGVVSKDGRYAFMNRSYRLPGKNERGMRRTARLGPVLIDLHTGETRSLGGEGSWIYVGTRGEPVEEAYVQQDGVSWLYDVRTLERKSAVWNDYVVQWSRRSYRLRDGRRAWFAGQRILCEGKDGGEEVLAEIQVSHFRPKGQGVASRNIHFYDFGRQRMYDRREMPLAGRTVLIRFGKWLVSRRRLPKLGGLHWELYDPDTHALEPARGLAPEDHVCAVHDDGRLFVWNEGAGTRLVDPESGVALVLTDARVWDAASVVHDPIRTPGGARVFIVYRGRSALGRFDAEKNTFAETGDLGVDPVLLGVIDEETAVVVVNETEIRTVRFGEDAPVSIYTMR